MMKAAVPFLLVLIVFGCSPARRITRELRTKPVYTDHFTGVAVYDPVQRRSLIQHNADKPFTPASNAKLFSFYAGLLSLRDSLPVLRYAVRNDSLIFWGTGNPLLLHPDLCDTTGLAFLRNRREQLFFSPVNYEGPRFGAGWAWDDYNDDYSPELAPMPIYGNVVRFTNRIAVPRRFADSTHISSTAVKGIHRSEFTNQFMCAVETKTTRQAVPFRWSASLAAQLLADTLHRSVGVVSLPITADARLIRGSSTDSLYKRMLYVSDNQFAEQVLFMASAEQHSVQLSPAIELRRIMDSLHYSTTAGSPVRWVDGSGLSRYNLFTPNILVDLLGRIYAKVPQKRLFALLPAVGKPYIFAKSGSMTGVYNLSGYVLTKRNKLLYLSIMHNNFTQPVSEMRRRTAELLMEIHERM